MKVSTIFSAERGTEIVLTDLTSARLKTKGGDNVHKNSSPIRFDSELTVGSSFELKLADPIQFTSVRSAHSSDGDGSDKGEKGSTEAIHPDEGKHADDGKHADHGHASDDGHHSDEGHSKEEHQPRHGDDDEVEKDGGPPTTTTTPEPAALALVGTGMLALVGHAARRRR